MQFEEVVYPVSENNGSLEVCVVLNGVTELNIAIAINLGPEGNANFTDFQFSPTTFNFGVTSSPRMCVEIGITQDNIIETEENFFLILSATNDSRIVLGDSIAEVIIEDSTTAVFSLSPVTPVEITEGDSTMLCLSNSIELEREVRVEFILEQLGGNALQILCSSSFELSAFLNLFDV